MMGLTVEMERRLLRFDGDGRLAAVSEERTRELRRRRWDDCGIELKEKTMHSGTSHYGFGPWSLQIQVKQFTHSSNGLFFLSSRVVKKRAYRWVFARICKIRRITI